MTTTITITDTGKRRTSSGTAEETDLANNGSAITLYSVEVTVEEKAILNTNPSIGLLRSGDTSAFTYGEVDIAGIEQPRWTIRGVLDDTNSAHLLMIKVFTDLCRTKGYKMLSGDVPDARNGAIDSSTVSVRFETFVPRHTSDNNIIEYTLTGYETA